MTPLLRTTLLLGALGLAACTNGSGGGPGQGASLGSTTGFGNSDPGPYSGTGNPGNRPSPPGTSPGGRPGPYATGGDVCDLICGYVEQCLGGTSACLEACNAELGSVPCSEELGALYRCAGAFITCKTDPKENDKEKDKEGEDSPIQIDEQGLKQCEDAFKALVACESSHQGSGGAAGSSQGGSGGSGAKGGNGQGQGGSGLGGQGGFGLGGQGGFGLGGQGG